MNAVARTFASENEANLSPVPVAPGQVYQMGLDINRLTEKMYHLLTAHCSGISDRDDKWLTYSRKEAELIKEKCTYFHHCELYYYYLSGGLMAVNYEAPLDSSALKSNIDWLLFKLHRNVEICESYAQDGYKLKSSEIYKFMTTIRNDIGNFYKSAAALYPQGTMYQAFITLNKLTVQINCKMFNSLQLLKKEEAVKAQIEGINDFVETCLHNIKTKGSAKLKIV